MGNYHFVLAWVRCQLLHVEAFDSSELQHGLNRRLVRKVCLILRVQREVEELEGDTGLVFANIRCNASLHEQITGKKKKKSEHASRGEHLPRHLGSPS